MLDLRGGQGPQAHLLCLLAAQNLSHILGSTHASWLCSAASGGQHFSATLTIMLGTPGRVISASMQLLLCRNRTTTLALDYINAFVEEKERLTRRGQVLPHFRVHLCIPMLTVTAGCQACIAEPSAAGVAHTLPTRARDHGCSEAAQCSGTWQPWVHPVAASP